METVQNTNLVQDMDVHNQLDLWHARPSGVEVQLNGFFAASSSPWHCLDRVI